METQAHGPGDRTMSAPAAGGMVPRWFARLLVVVLAGVAGTGLSALVLAWFGWATLPAMVGVGGVVTLLLSVLGVRGVAADPIAATRSDHAWAAAAVVLVAVSALANGYYTGHHVVIDRDPAVYVSTAKWIAETGALDIQAEVGGFAEVDGLSYHGAGFARNDDGRVEAQGTHLLPAMMALGHEIGGPGLMFRVPALLAAVALLAVYAVAVGLTRTPWLSAAATGTVGVSLPLLYVARDAYTEGATLLLLWGGWWCWMRMMRSGTRPPHAAAIAFCGAVLGTAVATRIDGPLYLVPLPLALSWLHGRTRSWRHVLAFVAALALPVAIGALDLLVWSTEYVRALEDQAQTLLIAVGAAWVVLGLGLLVRGLLVRRTVSVRDLVDRWQPRAALAAGVGTVIALAGLWTIQPLVREARADPSPFIEYVQNAQGSAIDSARRYDELAFRWMSWYLGPIVAVAAIFAAGVIVARLLRRAEPALGIPLLSVGAATVAYLVRPSVFPDQLWGTRRFVPNGLPLMAVLAAAGVAMLLCTDRVTAWRRRVSRGASAVAAAVVLAIFVAPSVAATAPIVEFSYQRGYLVPIQNACNRMGPDAVVVMVRGDSINGMLSQPIRAWCDVPVAIVPPGRIADTVGQVQRAWGDDHTIWLITDTHQTLDALSNGTASAVRLEGSAHRHPERRFVDPPDAYESAAYAFYIGPVPPLDD